MGKVVTNMPHRSGLASSYDNELPVQRQGHDPLQVPHLVFFQQHSECNTTWDVNSGSQLVRLKIAHVQFVFRPFPGIEQLHTQKNVSFSIYVHIAIL